MKQMKKIIILCLCIMMSVGILTTEKASASTYITFSNITSTSMHVDWSTLSSKYSDYTITGYKVSEWDVENGTDIVLSTNTTATSMDLYGLPSSTTIFITVEPIGVNASGMAVTGYEYNTCDTLSGSGVAGTISSSLTTGTSTITPSNPTPSAPTTEAITLATPSIKSLKLVDTTLKYSIEAPNAYGAEIAIYNKKTKKCVKTEEIYYTSGYVYNIKANNVYYAQVRTYTYDSNYNKVYSKWSAKKYFVAQPTINTKKSKITSNSIKLKWNKIQGAKNYTIYMKKTSSKKWKKVKTTTKTTYTIKKFSGKKLNTTKNRYDIRVIASAKVGKKTYKSDNSKYIYTYVIYK